MPAVKRCQRPGPEPGKECSDIWYDTADGVAKITINRPEVRDAVGPVTPFELSRAFGVARDDPSVGVIIPAGAGDKAFCSGGDQKIRGDDGYLDSHGVRRLNVLDPQVQIRRLPKYLCRQYSDTGLRQVSLPPVARVSKCRAPTAARGATYRNSAISAAVLWGLALWGLALWVMARYG